MGETEHKLRGILEEEKSRYLLLVRQADMSRKLGMNFSLMFAKNFAPSFSCEGQRTRVSHFCGIKSLFTSRKNDPDVLLKLPPQGYPFISV